MSTTSPKNILLLIPELAFGGAARVFHDHALALAAAGHQVAECVFDGQGRIDYPTRNVLVGLDVVAGTSFMSKVQAWRQRIQRLRQLKQQLAIDVCISHLEGADYLNLLSKGKEKVVLCVHNSKRYDPNLAGASGWLRRRLLMPALYRRADQIVTVSEGLRREAIAYLHVPAARVETITNFVDGQQVRQQAAEPLLPAEEALFDHGPVLLVVGRLAIEKNQVALLPVLAALQTAGSAGRVRLLLLGDGPLHSEIVAVAQAQGLQVWDGTAQAGSRLPDNPEAYDVILLGFRSNPFPYLARATVSLLSSLTEGFGMVLCEAFACGVPVASADCPAGPREILAPSTSGSQYAAQAEWAEYGLLLPMLQAEASDFAEQVATWAAALGQLLTDSKRRNFYAVQARRRADDFTPGPAMVRWERVIQASRSFIR